MVCLAPGGIAAQATLRAFARQHPRALEKLPMFARWVQPDIGVLTNIQFPISNIRTTVYIRPRFRYPTFLVLNELH